MLRQFRNTVLVLLVLVFIGTTLPKTFAQGTSDTNVTNATNGEVNQATVVIPFGQHNWRNTW
jgi:hypothetical protein